MNNQQKAEEYAAKIIESGILRWALDAFHTAELHDVLTDAVLHGIGIGYDMGFRDGLPPVDVDNAPLTKEELESIRIALEVVIDTPFYASSPTMQGVPSIISKVSKLIK